MAGDMKTMASSERDHTTFPPGSPNSFNIFPAGCPLACAQGRQCKHRRASLRSTRTVEIGRRPPHTGPGSLRTCSAKLAKDGLESALSASRKHRECRDREHSEFQQDEQYLPFPALPSFFGDTG